MRYVYEIHDVSATGIWAQSLQRRTPNLLKTRKSDCSYRRSVSIGLMTILAKTIPAREPFFQPVIPFSLDNGANIVTRTIIPGWQEDVIHAHHSGFGDILFSAWYSKTAENHNVGRGTVGRFPTGTEVSSDTGPRITGIGQR